MKIYLKNKGHENKIARLQLVYITRLCFLHLNWIKSLRSSAAGSSTKASYGAVPQLTTNDITAFSVTWSNAPSDVFGMQSLRKSITAKHSLLPNGDWQAQQNKQSANRFLCSVISSTNCFRCLTFPTDFDWSSFSISAWTLISRSFWSTFKSRPVDETRQLRRWYWCIGREA